MAEHIVKKVDHLEFEVPSEFDGRSSGYTSDPVVDEPGGAVQMGFAVSRLESGGHVDTHVHSFEESLYVVEGELTVGFADGSTETTLAGDLFYWPPGHTVRVDEDYEAIEFSPSGQMGELMNHLEAKLKG